MLSTRVTHPFAMYSNNSFEFWEKMPIPRNFFPRETVENFVVPPTNMVTSDEKTKDKEGVTRLSEPLLMTIPSNVRMNVAVALVNLSLLLLLGRGVADFNKKRGLNNKDE